MKTPYFSIFIPVYNSGETIFETLKSVLSQTFKDFEVVINDNNSQDNTLLIIKKFKDKRIKIFKNQKNIGYPGNLNKSLVRCKSNNIVLLAGDDLIDKDTLKWYYNILEKYPKAGAITRPYYWFESDYKCPIRKKLNTNNDLLVNIDSSFDKISLVLSSLDQLSGLCFKRNLTKQNFDSEPWISHAYPWLDIFKNHPIVFLKKYPLAVRIGNSATRTNIYQKSPMISWKELIDTVFVGDKYKKIHDTIVCDFIGINYVGLVQIRNYGSFTSYLREVKNLIIFRNKNLLNIKFWFYFLITLITPPKILRKISDSYKSTINKRFIDREIVIKL